MAQSLQLILTVEGKAADLISTKDRKSGLRRLYNYLGALVAGGKHASIDISSSTDAPVAAAGSIAPTQANVDADETVTIGGVVLTAKASGANGTTQFNKGANLAATCTNLAACINANTTLSKYLTATASSTAVALTCKQKGGIGNLIVMSTSDATAFTLTQLTGGAGGGQGTVSTYRVGL